MDATYIGFTDFGAPRMLAGELVRISKTRYRQNGSPEVLIVMKVEGELFHIHASEHFAVVTGTYRFKLTREWRGFDVKGLDDLIFDSIHNGATTVVSYRHMNLVDNRSDMDKEICPLSEPPVPGSERFLGRLLAERLTASMR